MRLGALVPRPNPPPRLWRPGVRDAAPTGSGDTCLPGRLRARGARRRGRETDGRRQRRRSTVPGEWGGGCRGGRCRLSARAPGAAAHSPPAPARLPRAEPRSCEALPRRRAGLARVPEPPSVCPVRVHVCVCVSPCLWLCVCARAFTDTRVCVCVRTPVFLRELPPVRVCESRLVSEGASGLCSGSPRPAPASPLAP